MAARRGDRLEQFHPLIADWFRATFGNPTPVQAAAWERIEAGRHCLISAPTGTGKTLAAFLTAIDRLIRGSSGRVLYISPLKALNYDIERNLNRPLHELRSRFAEAGAPFPEIRVGLRSGDTEQSERRRLISHPPDILVTTPESLNLMLSSKNGLRGLAGFETVILDEVHAVLSSKRGTYLMSGVERLVSICGEFQRIALSATIRPMTLAAEILGGYAVRGGGESYEARPVELVEVESRKQYELKIRYPNLGDQQAGTPEARDEWWQAIARRLRERISENRSTLVFANSRRMVEKLARMLNEEEEGEPVYAHHGSLSREVRRVVEERLKGGELKAIVATSSLELGIDVGEIDEVILVQAPYSIASAVQRIGRAGHGVGEVSRGSFLPIHSRDLLESAALTRAITEGAIEDINPPERPLDVLAQIILSMAVVGPVEAEEVYRTVRSVHAYHHLRREELELVVEMLAGKYADTRIRELNPRISYDRGTGRIEARKNAAMLLYMSGGVIPDRGYYTLRLSDSKAKIGELDEEFVWERSLGDAFPFGNRAWRITGITNNDVLVVPADSSNSVVPFWRAEEQSRPFVYSSKIGSFLEETDEMLGLGADLAKQLEESFFMEASAAAALQEYLKRQRMHTGASLPHRHHLVIERYYDPKNSADALQVVIHTIWGSAVNKPLALALSAAWRKRYGFTLEVYANNDAVLLNLPQEHRGSEIFSLLQGEDLSRLLRDSIEGGGIFGARFRENAQRALLLPRRSFSERMPLWLNRLRSKKLLKATADREDFPITLETWRECMQNEFDVATLAELLADLETGRITYSEVETVTPSPFADSIIWRQTNFRIYQDDSASSELRTSLSDELLEEVLHSPHLRPELPAELVADFERKLQRLAEGYAPESAAELLSWIEERLFLPASEWEAILAAMERDGVSNVVELVDSIRDRLFFPGASEAPGQVPIGVVAVSNRRLFDAALAGEPGEQGEEQEAAADRFLARWLDYYGPVPLHRLRTLLPLPAEALEEAVDHLTESGSLFLDRFTEGAREEELCSRENLERLLRLRRAEARPELEPLRAGEFQLFLARHQGVVEPGASLEALEFRLEQLLGYPARASLWESDILPARLDPYYPSWLDRAMGESDLRWIGCGNKRVTFAFESDLDLILEGPRRDDGLSEAAGRLVRALRSGGGRSFLDLAREAELRTDEATEALWELVWNGAATNDALQTLRQGVRTDFTPEGGAGATGERRPGVHSREAISGRGVRTSRRRGSYRRWSSTRPMGGTWFPMPLPPSPEDPLEEAELLKERVRLLLSRYGILFRELLTRELPPLQWGRLFRTLRLMELSGELTSGHFVDGVTGLQFISPAALRELSAGGGEDRVYWLNAADPASLCGSELPGELPRRIPTTHLVYQGAQLVLVSRKSGKELSLKVPPGAPRMNEYLSLFPTFLSRQESSLRRIRVETINGEATGHSAYAEDLKRFGFIGDGPYLTLYRNYADGPYG
ncbi:MAG: DEAD/DEAH box helicase [Spirochaetaceae bacterium]